LLATVNSVLNRFPEQAKHHITASYCHRVVAVVIGYPKATSPLFRYSVRETSREPRLHIHENV